MLRPIRSSVLVILVLLGAVHGARAGRFVLFERTPADVVIVTDVTPEGRKLTPPTAEAPVYFMGSSLGCKLGSVPGDRLPDATGMSDFVGRLLAKQGFLAAQPGVHEPTLYLVLQWGYIPPRSGDSLWFLGYDPAQDIAAPSPVGLLGAEVFRRGFRSREIETILDYAGEDIYGVIITAFEYKSASTPKPVIYWQTRMAMPTRGISMAQALPYMVELGAPQVGRETTKPILRDLDDRYTTKLGELEVIGFEDDERPERVPERKTSEPAAEPKAK